MPNPDQSADRPTEHNGIKIEREELINSPLLHKKAFFKYSRIHLTDGSIAFACRECLATADSRGDILVHRNREHGARTGMKPIKVSPPALTANTPLDLVLAPRADGPAPSDTMQMTVGEILALMPSIGALGDLVDKLERENEQLRAELNETRIDRATQHKIDVYETNREEIVSLRLQVQKWANYEQVKEEMYALRTWKRKILTKLNAVSSVVSEDDQ
jgi:hypothetical protein